MSQESQEQVIRTYCSLCKPRCGIVCYVEDGILQRVEKDKGHPAGGICIKGMAAPELVHHPERLMYPLKRSRAKGEADPGWQRISWEEALETIATQLLRIKQRYGPEAVVFGRGAIGGSPAADYSPFLLRLAHAFGSPNNVGTTHICNWHKDVESRYTYGTGIPYPDYGHTNCILIWGHNPQVSWPLEAIEIGKARRPPAPGGRAGRGAKLIVVDPRQTPLAAKADIWLQPRPGTDGALALAMLQVIVKERLYDEAFVHNWTNGSFLVRQDNHKLLSEADIRPGGDPTKFMVWDQATAASRPLSGVEAAQAPSLSGEYPIKLSNGLIIECRTAWDLFAHRLDQYPPEQVERICWVPAKKIREAARLFATTKPSCYYSYVGIEEHTNAHQTNRALCLLYVLTGNFDAPGGNVIFPRPRVNALSGEELLPEEKAKIRLGRAERPLGPAGTVGSVQAYEVYKAILTGRPYPVKGMFCLGGNLFLSNGDPLKGREALARLEFYVHGDLFENPPNRLADILLPSATCFESEHLRTTFEMGPKTCSFIQMRKEVVPPVGESWPDTKIVLELANRLGLGHLFWQGDVEAAYNFQLAPLGITLEEVRQKPEGMHIPMPVKYKKYEQMDPATGRPRGFSTPTRRVEIYSQTLLTHGYDPLPNYEEPRLSPLSQPDLARNYPLVLTSAKLHQFCHTQHRNIPMLRKRVPHPFLEIHPDKAKEMGIKAGDWVILETPMAAIRLKAKLTEGIDPRVVCTQHGWWQACTALNLPELDAFGISGANVNLLVSNELIDPLSGSVPHRSYLCRVRKA